jgi:hypothetical protein
MEAAISTRRRVALRPLNTGLIGSCSSFRGTPVEAASIYSNGTALLLKTVFCLQVSVTIRGGVLCGTGFFSMAASCLFF